MNGAARAHGHCVYAQNLPDTGTKVVRHNLFATRSGRTINGNYGLHFYAKGPVLGGFNIWENAVKGAVAIQSRNAHCDRINSQSNVVMSLLVGASPETDSRGNSFGKPGRPDRSMMMRDNVFIDGVKRLENRGWKGLTAERNRIVKTKTDWWPIDMFVLLRHR